MTETGFEGWWAFDNGTNTTNASCPGAEKLDAQWVHKAFGECVDTPLKYVAFFIGLSSILCWLVAQAPQMVTNCRLGIADKALSFWFLLQWFLGDTTNLIGALLTHQLPSQIITAVYFCFIDTLMMSQYFYYVVKNQGWKGLPRIFLCPKIKPSQDVAIFLPGLICTMLLASAPRMGGVFAARTPYTLDSTTVSGRVLLEFEDGTHKPPIDPHNSKDLIGYIFGCVSALFYLGSRLPQIIQNFMRCSVEGVSLPMFILAVMGNVTYSLGIFLYSVDGDFLIAKLPWLVGSIGTLCFDFTIFTQFIIYRHFGARCRHGDDEAQTGEETDDERKPLLQATANGNGLPCFGQQGNIQEEDRVEEGRKGWYGIS